MTQRRQSRQSVPTRLDVRGWRRASSAPSGLSRHTRRSRPTSRWTRLRSSRWRSATRKGDKLWLRVLRLRSRTSPRRPLPQILRASVLDGGRKTRRSGFRSSRSDGRALLLGSATLRCRGGARRGTGSSKEGAPKPRLAARPASKTAAREPEARVREPRPPREFDA